MSIFIGGVIIDLSMKKREKMTETMNFTQEWDKTFKLSEEVEHKKVTFTKWDGGGIGVKVKN